MTDDAFTALAEPTRRRILDRLARSERSVGELVDDLGITQPSASKHLRVLRSHGFVSCRVDTQRRVYRLEPEPFAAVAAWLAPYHELWDRYLDELEAHLDRTDPDRTATEPEDHP